MGFSSFDCLGCFNSIRNFHSGGHNPWMYDAVVIPRRGGFYEGLYDGYGRLDGKNIFNLTPLSAYHRACWLLVGSPRKFTKASPNAYDQGHFTDYDPPEPRSIADLEKLREHAMREEVERLEEENEYDVKRLESGIDIFKRPLDTKERRRRQRAVRERRKRIEELQSALRS